MMYWGDNLSGWGWGVMSGSMLLFFGLLIAVVVLLVRSFANKKNPSPVLHRGSPEQQLAARFARGEISEDEFTRRLATLRGLTRS